MTAIRKCCSEARQRLWLALCVAFLRTFVLAALFFTFAILSSDPGLAQSSCPWHCQVWSPDGCSKCSCVKGRVEDCDKALCDQPRQRGRCISPKSASFYGPHDCKWFGTAPMCAGSCPVGYYEVMRDKKGDGKKCWSGSKAYCCPQYRGQSAEFCFDYAETAVRQYQLAVSNNCSVSGPEWNPNFDYHFDWCVRLTNATVSAATNGTQYREQYLTTRCHIPYSKGSKHH